MYVSQSKNVASVSQNIFWVQRKPYKDWRNNKNGGTGSVWSWLTLYERFHTSAESMLAAALGLDINF